VEHLEETQRVVGQWSEAGGWDVVLDAALAAVTEAVTELRQIPA
jgi:hypothetical protein